MSIHYNNILRDTIGIISGTAAVCAFAGRFVKSPTLQKVQGVATDIALMGTACYMYLNQRAVIPPTQPVQFAHFQNRIAPTCDLITPNMDDWEQAPLLMAMCQVSAAEREKVCAQALHFMTPEMSGWEKTRLLETVDQIPAAEREEVCAQALHFMTPEMSARQKTWLLEIVQQIPAAEREEVCAQALHVMMPEMSCLEKWRLLETVYQIPAAERQDVITRACRFPFDRDKTTLLETIYKIPAAERKDVIEQACRFPSFDQWPSNSYHIRVVGQIPTAEQQDTITQVLLLIRSTEALRNRVNSEMDCYERADLFEAICRVPFADREEVCTQVINLLTPHIAEHRFTEHLLNAVASIPRHQRAAVIAEVFDMEPAAQLNFFQTISRIHRTERADVIDRAMALMASGIRLYDRKELIREIELIPRAQRDLIIAEALLLDRPGLPIEHKINVVRMDRLHRQAVMNAPLQQFAQGIDVHDNDRDRRTGEAVQLLRENQGPVSDNALLEATQAFVAYLEQSTRDTEVIAKAKKALIGVPRAREESFGSLCDGQSFGLIVTNIKGEELIGRLWLYASNLPATDATNAKEGMISALANSYNFDSTRICNQGKAQHLVLAVLQGNLPGVNIEGTAIGEVAPVRIPVAIEMFFNIEGNRTIDTLEGLLQAANRFCTENVRVPREAFLREIRTYAEKSEIT